MKAARSEFRHTPLWAAVANTVAALKASGEMRIETGDDYVIDHICRELAAKRVVTEAALALTPGR